MIAWLRREWFLWRVRRTLRKSRVFTERVRRDIDALPTPREWFDLVSPDPEIKRITPTWDAGAWDDNDRLSVELDAGNWDAGDGGDGGD